MSFVNYPSLAFKHRMDQSRSGAAVGYLHHLADLAIGSPVLGAVNFPALHTLLHAIIQQLHAQGAGADLSGGPCPPPAGGLPRKEGGQEDRMAKGLLTYLPPRLEQSAETAGQEGGSAVQDLWKEVQLKGRLEVTEEGVCKAMTVLQDLMLEINVLKDAQREIQDQIQSMAETTGLDTGQQLEQKHSDLKGELEMESLQTEMELLKTQMKELEEKFEVFHETLARNPKTSNQDVQMSFTSQPSDNGNSPMPRSTYVAEICVSNGPMLVTSQTIRPQTQGSSQAVDSALPLQTPHVSEDGLIVNTLEDTLVEMSGQQHETNLTYSETSMPLNTEINPSMTTATPGSPHVTPAPSTGVTSRKNTMLYTRVDARERDEADRTELGLLQKNTDDLTLTLQELQENLTSELQDLRENTDKDGELIGNIQKEMSQLQDECERLTRTTGSLTQDREQNQQHIDTLYKTLQNLDKKKVDKELMGLQADVKAEHCALESKVSRTQFDATTEHLSRMIQELLGKVSTQEQDWQRLLEKINVEMQNKLDRIELEPLKNILEQCWRDLRRQLPEHPPQCEADEAAGIRKQLMRRFHCISCNRTVDMMVPGSEILTIPNIPGLPAHRSIRPYTVFELDRVRQQCRSDRLPQLVDFGYMSSARNCGGSHTLTFPQRRFARLPTSMPCAAQKEDFVGGVKEELFILGQDGQIYRGRKDNHLPTIRTKDDKRSTDAYQKMCDCNLKGEENVIGRSSPLDSNIH